MARIDKYIMSSAERANRQRYIGGSDANTLMNGSDEDIIQLWKEKRGEEPPKDLSDIIAVGMGKATEDYNMAVFERETGLIVTGEAQHIISPDVPFMACTLDGWIEAESAVFESKHCSGFEDFHPVIVNRYIPQLQHNMAVTDAHCAYLSAFLGTNRLEIYKMARDQDYIDALIEIERNFLECVQNGTPPRPIKLIPPETPMSKMRVVDMTGHNLWAVQAMEYLDTRDAAKRNERAKEELKGLIDPDVREAYGHGVVIKRDKRGSLRLSEEKK